MDKKTKEFNELLKKDLKAQKQLQTAKDEESFIKLYCQIAKQKGYDISAAEAREFLSSLKHKMRIDHKLKDEDFKKMAGGSDVWTEGTRYCD